MDRARAPLVLQMLLTYGDYRIFELIADVIQDVRFVYIVCSFLLFLSTVDEIKTYLIPV